jgi:plastocyanin
VRVHRALIVLGAAALVAAAIPAGAEAKLKTVTVRQGPFSVGPYQVRYTDPKARGVRPPRLNGYIVRMRARVVDKRGRRIPVRRLMLHHVLYKNLGRFKDDRSPGICGETKQSFFGTGEENQALKLPEGYGYRIHRRDHWHISWMLMNHRNRRANAYIQYTAKIETKRKLRAVTPYWVRVTGCGNAVDPIYNVPGGAARGSTAATSLDFRLPRPGMLIAANAHIHGGSKGLIVSQPGCGNRRLMVSRPLYGYPNHPYYNVRPVLHEPGPFASSWPRSATGIPVGPGEPLRLTSLYDGELPHTRVMGIMHVYVDHGRRPARASCAPLPVDMQNWVTRQPGRLEPPRVIVPLTGLDANGRAYTITQPPGPTRLLAGDAAIRIGRASFSLRNLSIPLGASVSWTSLDRKLKHNATLANGPEGFGSPNMRNGRSFTRRFGKPGLYRIFCSLHPIKMTQTIRVRSR